MSVDEEAPTREIAAEQMSFQRGQRQQRRPGDERQDQDAPLQQQQRIVGQSRPTQKLEDRTALHQREIQCVL